MAISANIFNKRQMKKMNVQLTHELLTEAYELEKTFTISYPFGIYKDSRYSTTYDELTKWLRKTIAYLKSHHQEYESLSPYQYLNTFRGKLGNIDQHEFKKIIGILEQYILYN